MGGHARGGMDHRRHRRERPFRWPGRPHPPTGVLLPPRSAAHDGHVAPGPHATRHRRGDAGGAGGHLAPRPHHPPGDGVRHVHGAGGQRRATPLQRGPHDGVRSGGPRVGRGRALRRPLLHRIQAHPRDGRPDVPGGGRLRRTPPRPAPGATPHHRRPGSGSDGGLRHRSLRGGAPVRGGRNGPADAYGGGAPPGGRLPVGELCPGPAGDPGGSRRVRGWTSPHCRSCVRRTPCNRPYAASPR